MAATPRWQRWREVLSRAFGAVDMGVPDEVECGAIRASLLGPVQAVVVDGGPLRARRTRRLIARSDNTERHLFASDRGLDGAGASAEEAEMHVTPDSESC
ncbi:DUF5709 domain-containing protein [Streptomyces cyanogenus]|uniref:DUF5709 domain-containing protein n=1 Tax=Streptomyces cyanogenus TaxID=80860 RepID=A0ABX7U4M5_STRCY|nr:DUF5709 domain-containing protein [Streptomyces cyanogenus]QTE02889.1 hypothetical protein S1361_36485 [Streptomyces cyanogenus]